MKSVKKLKEKTDLYIELTDEEISELGWKPNQKLSMSVDNDGVIKITPYVTVDIDLSNFSKEILEFLVIESCKKDVSVNEIIEDVLKKNMS